MSECIDLTELENSNLENVNFSSLNSKKVKAEKVEGEKKVLQPTSKENVQSQEVELAKSAPPQLKKDEKSGAVDEDIEVLGTTGESVADWPHAREHCIKNPFASTAHEKTCDKCMCFVCEIPAGKCTSWSVHCQAVSGSSKWIKIRDDKRKGIETKPQDSLVNQKPEVRVDFQAVFISGKTATLSTSLVIGMTLGQFKAKMFSLYGKGLNVYKSYVAYLNASMKKNKQEESHTICALKIVEKGLSLKEFVAAMSSHLSSPHIRDFLRQLSSEYEYLFKLHGAKRNLFAYLWYYKGTLKEGDIKIKGLEPFDDGLAKKYEKLCEATWSCKFKPMLAGNMADFKEFIQSRRGVNSVSNYIHDFGLHLTTEDFFTANIGPTPGMSIFRKFNLEVRSYEYVEQSKSMLVEHQPSGLYEDLSAITNKFDTNMHCFHLECELVDKDTLKFNVQVYLTRQLPAVSVFYERFVLQNRYKITEDTILGMNLSVQEPIDVDPDYVQPLELPGSDDEDSSSEIEEDEEDEKPVDPVIPSLGAIANPLPFQTLGHALIFHESPADYPKHSFCTNVHEIPLAKTAEEEGYEAEGRYIHMECSLKFAGISGTAESKDPYFEGDSLNSILYQQYHRGGRTVPQQPPGLTMTLRNYQLQDLQWMLDQEKGEGGISRYFWSKVGNIYHSHLLGAWSKTPPAPTKGGVLADEMGLGKTIVTLSVVLANPASEDFTGVLVPPALEAVKSELVKQKAHWFRKRHKITWSSKNYPEYSKDLKAYKSAFRTAVQNCDFDLTTIGRMETIFSLIETTVPLTQENLLDTMLLSQPINIKLPKNASQQTKQKARWKAKKANQMLLEAMQKVKEITAKYDPNVVKSYISVKETLQKINALRTLTTVKGTLVICHVSLVSQWVAEARKASGSTLRICCYYGSNRPQSVEELQEFDVVVTTYAVLNSDSRQGLSHQRRIPAEEYQPPLMQVKWHRVVLDESHALRNAGGNNVKLCSKLSSEIKWCMTGTPMAKDVKEMYGQLKFVVGANPVLGSLETFTKNMDIREYRYRLLKAMMIIHGKKQIFYGKKVLADLPPIEKFHIKVDFTHSERLDYLTLKTATYQQFAIDKNSSSVTYLLSLMNPLRRACSFGIANSRMVENGHKKAKLLKQESGNDVNPATLTKNLPLSIATSKITYMVNHLKQQLAAAADSKALIFTSFTHGVEVVAKALQENNIAFVKLIGGTQESARRKALEKFNYDEVTKVFLMSIRSGGVGINITRANLVYILEPNMNSALEKQAIGRVHRMGQKRKVKIYHMIMKGSIEERVLKYRDNVVKAKHKTQHNPLTKKKRERDEDDDNMKINVSSETQRQRLVAHLEQFLL